MTRVGRRIRRSSLGAVAGGHDRHQLPGGADRVEAAVVSEQGAPAQALGVVVEARRADPLEHRRRRARRRPRARVGGRESSVPITLIRGIVADPAAAGRRT